MIENPLTDKLLCGQLDSDSDIFVAVKNGEIVFTK